MRVIEQLIMTKNRLAKQKLDFEEYLSHQIKNYRSLIVENTRNNIFDFESYRSRFFVAAPRVLEPELINAKNAVSECEVDPNIFVSEWMLVSQEMVNAFASVTGDEQWIHTDPSRAAIESPYHSTVAHGFLILSLIPLLSAQRNIHDLCTAKPRLIINTGINNVRFLQPLKTNSYIRAGITTIFREERKNGFVFTEKIIIETSTFKTISVADAIYRIVF